MSKISVVMPAYNAEKYIGEAIESILNQTYTDFEFIIINDGSTDRTKEIIDSYNDSRIVYLENEKNSGIVVTLNKGLDFSTGEYIARMDADDVAVGNRLEKQVTYMEKNKNVGLLGTGIRIFGDEIEASDRVFTTDSKQLKAELLFSSCIAHPTVMIRRDVLEQNKLRYNSEFAGAEDYCLWWEISKVCTISTLPDILLNYRIHSSQITQKKDESYYNMMKKLTNKRFGDIGIELSEKEKAAFEVYCFGEYKQYSLTDLKVFVDCLNHILKHNQVTKYFEQSKLNKIFELSVIYALNNSALTTVERKKVYGYAVKSGLFTMLTRIKVAYHGMYR